MSEAMSAGRDHRAVMLLIADWLGGGIFCYGNLLLNRSRRVCRALAVFVRYVSLFCAESLLNGDQKRLMLYFLCDFLFL